MITFLALIGGCAILLFSFDLIIFIKDLLMREVSVYHKMVWFKPRGKDKYYIGVVNIDDEDGIRIDYNAQGYNNYDCCWFTRKDFDESIKSGKFKFIPFFCKPITYMRTVG